MFVTSFSPPSHSLQGGGGGKNGPPIGLKDRARTMAVRGKTPYTFSTSLPVL